VDLHYSNNNSPPPNSFIKALVKVEFKKFPTIMGVEALLGLREELMGNNSSVS